MKGIGEKWINDFMVYYNFLFFLDFEIQLIMGEREFSIFGVIL